MLLGVGAAGSPRHAPAGLLLEYGPIRLGFDGGPGSEPPDNVHAWLISDPFDPLQPDRRRTADAASVAGVRRLVIVWQSETEPDGEQPHGEWAEEGRTYRF